MGVERGGPAVGRNVNGKVDVRARSNLFIKVSRLPSVSSMDEDEMWLTARIVLLGQKIVFHRGDRLRARTG